MIEIRLVKVTDLNFSSEYIWIYHVCMLQYKAVHLKANNESP